MPQAVKNGRALFRKQGTNDLVSFPVGEAPPANYAPVEEQEIAQEIQASQDESATGVAKTFASRALSGASNLVQTMGKYGGGGVPINPTMITDRMLLSNQVDAEVADAAKAGSQLPINPDDTGRPLWMQLAGASDGSEKALADEEARLSKANPLTGLAGEIASQVFVPSAMGGAKTLAAKAGIGALEGVGQGYLDAGTQARLEGRGTASTAERLTAMAIGGILGGTLGAAVHGGGKAVGLLKSRAATKAAEAVGQDVPAAVAAPGILDRAAKSIGDAQVKWGGADPEAMAIGGVGSTHPDRELFREVTRNPQRTVKEQAEKLGEALEVTANTEEQIHSFLGDRKGEVWREQVVSDLMGDIDESTARGVTGKMIRELRTSTQETLDRIDTALAMPANIGGASNVTKFTARLRAFGDELTEIQHAVESVPGTNGAISAPAAYARLNALKREASDFVTKYMPQVGSTEVRIGSAGQYIDEVREAIGSAQNPNGIFGATRNFLEDEKVWGRAGYLQKELNAGTHDYLSVSDQFNSHLGNWVGKDYESGRRVWATDKAKMPAAITALGSAPDGQFARDMSQRMRGLERATRVLKELKVEGFGDLDSALTSIGKARETTAESARRARWVDMYTEQMVGTQRKWDALGVSRPASMGVMGAWMFGLPGALGGVALSMLFRPAALMDTAHQLRSFVNRTFGPQIEKGARAVVSGGETVASQKSGLISRAVKRSPVKTAGLQRAATIGGIAAFTGGQPIEKAYEEKTSQIRALAKDPTEIMGRVAGVSPGLSGDAELASETMVTVQRAIDFLNSRIPAAGNSPGMFDRQDLRTPRDAMHAWANDYMAVTNPMGILESATKGRITQAQVDVLKAVYPDIYAEIKEHAMDESTRYATESKIPYSVKTQLDILLGLQGAGVPQLSVSTSQQILGASRAKKQSRQLRESDKLSGAAQTPDANWPSRT